MNFNWIYFIRLDVILLYLIKFDLISSDLIRHNLIWFDLIWQEDESDQSIEFSVFENNATAVIGLVSEATDADEPSNQLIFYFIVSKSISSFCFVTLRMAWLVSKTKVIILFPLMQISNHC